MAITNSIAMGRARKSAGNVTFRVVRGRTIASQKVTSSPSLRSPSASQMQRRAYFMLMSRFATMHSASIKASFGKTKYGSERNRFFELNYNLMMPAWAETVVDPDAAYNLSDVQINNIITAYATENPGVIVRSALPGQPRTYLTGSWGDVEDPEPPTSNMVVNSVSDEGTSISYRLTPPGVRYQGVVPDIVIAGYNFQNADVAIINASDGSSTEAAEGVVISQDGRQILITDSRIGITGNIECYGFRITKGSSVISVYLL